MKCPDVRDRMPGSSAEPDTIYKNMTAKEFIPFNRPCLTGKEARYTEDCIKRGKTCGNGEYTARCQDYFTRRLGSAKCMMTTSCTDALEMAAMLSGIRHGDEVIVPSYTFVSTALAFARQGADIIFADSRSDNPDIDTEKIESLITPRTRAIVPVHYAGIACDMDRIMEIGERHKLLVIEDAAQAIDSYYKGRPLGSIGHMACFSFHETKNIQCGEGGLLAINDPEYVKRAEIIWEKGTNRQEFFRGEVNKYGWVDTGSSFLPADYVCAFLWAQLEDLEQIQNTRKEHWNHYDRRLRGAEGVNAPALPDYATNNAHAYYIVCNTADERTRLIQELKEAGIHAVFHYLSLHKSDYSHKKGWDGSTLPEADRYTDCLLRLPMFRDLTHEEVDRVCDTVIEFYARERKGE